MSMDQIVGRMIRQHVGRSGQDPNYLDDDVEEQPAFIDIGRVVHVDRDREYLYYMPFPKKRKGKPDQKSWHMPSPKSMPMTDIGKLVREPDGQESILALVEFPAPLEWRLTDEELRSGTCKTGLVGRRADLKTWIRDREEWWSWIEPIVDNKPDDVVRDLVEFGMFESATQARAKELGHKDEKKVRRVLCLWLMGCHERNALLPCRFELGGRGKSKNFKLKPGRPQQDYDDRIKPTKGYLCTPDDHEKLYVGWKTYKKRGVSVYRAYLKTMAQYWPGSQQEKGANGEVFKLANIDDRPTEAEFRNAAKRKGAQSARRIEMGEQVHNLRARALRGSSSKGVVAVGQVAVIDSTPEDQTPASILSRTLVLPSTYRTIIIDVLTGYILGVHCGFEKPSTLTSLLAILSAASSKVEMCAKHGVLITEDQWFSHVPKRVRADNGELKSEQGIDTLTRTGISLEFTASYAAVLKNIVESSHHSIHAQADHLAAGSTQGKRRERGEPDRNAESCRTFEDNMPFVIRAILRHNNEVPVPHLLKPRMVYDKVEPTRAAIFKWYRDHGYITSQPQDLGLLRSRCLPALTGVIERDGIHIRDPRPGKTKVMTGLVFSNAWLRASGLCVKSDKRAKEREVKVHLHPNELDQCYFDLDRTVHVLENQSESEEEIGMTLCEYLSFLDMGKVGARALKGKLQESDHRRFEDNDAVNKSAKAAKAAEVKDLEAAGEQPAKPREQSKRDNWAEEIEARRQADLGLGGHNKDTKEVDSSGSDDERDDREDEEDREEEAMAATKSLMARFRESRTR
jgi:hypothetical protein